MILKDGMLLYHGSYAPVEEINLDMCAFGKDFGRGFYLTEDSEQARGFIKNSLKKAKGIGAAPESQNYGFVSVFKYISNDIPVYEFKDADREWLWFVSLNRRSYLASELKENLSQNLLNAEIVVGKIANDTTNPTIMAYLDGLYGDIKSERAINFAVESLLPDRLKNQYCFLTDRAVKCLEPVEIIKYEQ